MKSVPFRKKLDNLLREDPTAIEIGEIIGNNLSSFRTSQELKKHLTEGSLLNIGRISADALSIPNGKYMIWTTDVGHTMLVPVESTRKNEEVFESNGQYEVLTPALMNQWKTLEKCLSEEQPPEFQGEESESESESDSDSESKEKSNDTTGKQFTSKIDPGKIDRNPMLRAMEQQGQTVTSLANATGVQPPMISRLLRTPKDRQGDPGGRNPSIGLASAVANTLRMDVEALFPDIFGTPKGDLAPRQSPGNRGSGMTGSAHGSKRKGAATEKWTQGS